MARTLKPAKTSLLRIMREKGVTAKELAEASGVPASTLTNVSYNGHKQKLAPSKALAVAIALGVEPEALADVTGTRGGRGEDPVIEKKPETKGSPWREKGSAVTNAKAAGLKPMAEPKESKPWSDKDPEMEKVWLYLHQMGRRLRDCEERLRVLEAKR